MIPLPSRRTTLLLGVLATLSSSAVAGEVVIIADRCAVYGAGYADLGNGACGLRRSDGTRGAWTAGASNAGLRSDGLGMLPGAGNARHLRIQADPYLR